MAQTSFTSISSTCGTDVGHVFICALDGWALWGLWPDASLCLVWVMQADAKAKAEEDAKALTAKVKAIVRSPLRTAQLI